MTARPHVSLSVVMPALNEARNIDGAIRGVLAMIDHVGIDGEVLVLTCLDAHGRHDGTVDIVRHLATVDPRVRSVHAESYQRLGEKFRDGVLMASKTHVVMIYGDNEFDPESIERMLRRIGEADIIFSYTENPNVRAWYRRALSHSYTLLVNLLFWRRVRYYNGINIYRTTDLQSVLPRTDSFALGAECALRLLHAGCSYIEMPVRIRPRHGESKALTWDNFRHVVGGILGLRLTIGRK